MDLCREIIIDEGVKYQLVLFIVYVLIVMDVLYNDMGNFGKGGIILFMKDMWYWFGIYSNVEILIDYLL